MLDFLNGYKTYIVAGATVIFAAVRWWNGRLDANAAIAMIMGALGFSAVRSGVNVAVDNAAKKITASTDAAVKKALTAPK